MGKVCKVEKLRSTFHTFHDYLNFCGEKKDDGLLTIYVLNFKDRIDNSMYIHLIDNPAGILYINIMEIDCK